MFKANFKGITIFLFIKYLMFFIILGFIGDRFKIAVINNSETSIELFKLTLGYLFYIILYSVPLILIFIIPFKYVLNIKRGGGFVLLLTILFTIEYVVYTHFYAPLDKILGLYNFLIGITLFLSIYYKEIRMKFI